MNKLFLVFVLGTSLALFGCSDSNDGSTAPADSSGSAMTMAFVQTTTAMETVTNLQPAARSAGKAFSDNDTDLWNATASEVFRDDTASSPTLISPKAWMRIQLDADAQRSNGSKISIFGRFREALTFFCAVGLGLDSSQLDADNYPEDGTLTMSITTETATAFRSSCGIEDAMNYVGGDLKMIVTTPSDTTAYDKQVVLTLPTGWTQTFLLRSDGSEINVATLEVNSYGISRTVVDYDLSNRLLKVEYLSAPDNSTLGESDTLYTYRLLVDQANDEAHLMMGFHEEHSSGDKDVRYILAGKPVLGDQYSLTLESTALNSGQYEACVSATDGNLVSDNSSCGDGPTTVAGINVDGSVVDGFADSGRWNPGHYNTVGAATTRLSFTKATFASASFSQD